MSLAALQNFIHRLELGGGLRVIRRTLTVLALITVIGCYNLRAFRNFSTQEAMDAAQLGRNIAEGQGYSTLFIRPLSIYLVKKENERKKGKGTADAAALKTMHPDITNPPLYPVLLAGVMKVLPFQFQIPAQPKPSFWNPKGSFYRYQPDFLIGLLNQILFFGMVVLIFLLARKLFDPTVAWISAILLIATELFWHFTVSGLSTILLMLIFAGLAWSFVLLEAEDRTPKWGTRGKLLFAIVAAICLGAGTLTRYSFGWLLIPVLLFIVLFGGARRIFLAAIVLIVFSAILFPWIARNLAVSGTPFGTATYTLLETTILSPGNRLQRTLEPAFSNFSLLPYWLKLMTNLRQIVQNDLPKLGGSWISAFFLVGLLIGFRNPSLSRLRYFILMCLPVLIIVQALGRTHLSEDSPEINSENLLVVLAPMVLLFGVGFFFVLLEQHPLASELRYGLILLFGLIASLPMILIFLPPKTHPVAYPPYNPPIIQYVGDWMKPSELTMSDVPWAMAWYGHRQCVWLTLKASPDASDPTTREDFLAINDYLKPIGALYLTPKTMDARFFSEWISAGELSWGSFILESFVKKELPPAFPLHKMMRAWLPTGQLVLTDWDRWSARKAGE